MHKKWISGIASLILLAGCSSSTGTANPASVYCTEQGGTLEIRDEAGGQVGYCLFDDGSECEEWAFYRKECQPGDSLIAPTPTQDY